jgi:hypothetical protein
MKELDELKILIGKKTKKKKEFPFDGFSLKKRPKHNNNLHPDLERYAKECDVDPDDMFEFMK